MANEQITAETETAWLLEKMHDGNVHYICADYVLQWTDDPNKALRLARREDAEALTTIVEDCERIAEHEWPGSPPSDTGQLIALREQSAIDLQNRQHCEDEVHDLREQLKQLREESLKGICVYCGEIQQYESLEQKSGPEGNRIRVEHVKQCAQRPELKLIAYCEELQEAAKAAHGWIARVSNQYFLGADDPHHVLAKLNAVLNPKPSEG